MTPDEEDIDYYIDQCKNLVQFMEGQQLSKEDQEHLEHIRAWCKASPLLWKIVTKIGREMNGG